MMMMMAMVRKRFGGVIRGSPRLILKNNALYLIVNVFNTKVLIRDTIFTSPTGDGTAILRGHPSHSKVLPLAVQREYLHFSVILRPWVLVRPRELNPRPPALLWSALPTELILPRLITIQLWLTSCSYLYSLYSLWTGEYQLIAKKWQDF